MSYLDQLAQSIKTKRAQLGMTQADLAQRVNISQAMLARIELGDKAPSLQLSHAIALALGCTLADLFEEEAS